MLMKTRGCLLILLLLISIMISAAKCGDREQVRKDILRVALEIEGLRPAYRQYVSLKNPRNDEKVHYMMDCSGFVFAVYKTAIARVLDMQANSPDDANGVKIIYDTLDKLKKIYRKKIPNVGDIVFFDNTYDRNENGLADDELVHVGIVVAASQSGTITFLHSSTTEGVTRGYANLFYPNLGELNGETINSNLRRQKASDSPNTKYYAGALIRAFGAASDIPQEGDDF